MNTGEMIALIKAFGGSGSSLPSVSSSDNGKVLGVVDGAWAAQAKKFIVTLTPTALDYSGTMDKTVAEINAAYEAGMEVVFHTVTGANDWVETPLAYYAANGSDYHGFSTTIIQIAQNLLIVALVASDDDGTKQTYATKVYSLTPAS